LSNGSFTAIAKPGATLTDVEGINARGDIVGFYIDSSGNFHGLLLSDGRFTTIDVPGVAQTFGCFGINAEGYIVGSSIDSSGNDHGFLLSDSKFTTIDFPGAVATDLNDINPSGDIVGQYADSDGNEHGFILSK
jgi:probable HAF family extracellular repeat protein